jgi:hypothetical protein
VSEIHVSNIILSEFIATRRALALAISQVFFDAFSTKHVKASRDGY